MAHISELDRREGADHTNSAESTDHQPAAHAARSGATALREMAQQVGATLGVSVVAVSLLEPASGDLVIRAYIADAPDAAVAREGTHVGPDDVAAEVAARLAPVCLVGTDERLRVYLAGAGMEASLVCAPLIHAGDLLGTLVLASPDGRAAEAASEAAYVPLCALVASAISAVGREEAAQESARLTARLLSVTRSLTSSLDPAHARAAAVMGIRRMVHCDQVALLVREERDASAPHTGPLTRHDLRVATQWSASPPSGDATSNDTGASAHRRHARARLDVTLDERQWQVAEWVAARRCPRALAPGEVASRDDQDEHAEGTEPATLIKHAEGAEAAEVDQRGAADGAHAEPASEEVAPALYGMPLETGSGESANLLGAVLVGRERAFTQAEIQLLAHLGHIVAVAIAHCEAHQVARIQHERLAAILASASDGLAIVDSALMLLEVNPAFARLLGHSAAELRGVRICEALHGHPDTGCLLCPRQCLTRQVLETGEPLAHVVCELGGPDVRPLPSAHAGDQPLGKQRTVDFSLTAVAGPDGQGVLLIGRDMTAARETERMRASFLSLLSHELRQPLQSIIGWIGIALEPPNLPRDPQQRTFLRRAFIATEHLAALVDDLLLLSSREAGTFSLQPKHQDIVPLLRPAIEEMEIRAAQENVRLRLKAPDTLPEVAVDGLRLSQVLRNLLANAIKFTPSGGRVTLSADATPDEVVIAVHDTGIGISPEHHERIFERNFQVPTNAEEAERHRGHGLGLAIVRIIVEGHGGTVSVESTPGTGSTFAVHLPR